MSPSDLERLSLLIEQIKQLRPLLDEDKAEAMIRYLEGKVNSISAQRLDLLRRLREGTVRLSPTLGESAAKSILATIDTEIEQLTPPPAKRENILKGAIDIDFGDTVTRRMPVYVLIDNSRDIGDGKTDQVEQMLHLITNELLNQPQAIEMVWIAVISMSSPARLITPLSGILSFRSPTISQRDAPSDVVGAFDILKKSIENELIVTTAARKGDYKPIAFLITSGQFGNQVDNALELLGNRRQKTSIIAIACGDKPNLDILRQITESILLVQDTTPDNVRAFFRWQSASVSSSEEDKDDTSTLPPPPSGFQVIP